MEWCTGDDWETMEGVDFLHLSPCDILLAGFLAIIIVLFMLWFLPSLSQCLRVVVKTKEEEEP